MILIQRLCNFILFCAIFQWISLSRIEASTATSQPETTPRPPSTSTTTPTTTTTTVTSTEPQTTTSKSTTAAPPSSGCGAGCIAGCVIGVLALIALIVVAVIFTMRYTKQHPDCCRRKEDKHSYRKPLPDPNRLSDIRHTDISVSLRAGGESALDNQYVQDSSQNPSRRQADQNDNSTSQSSNPRQQSNEDLEMDESKDAEYENTRQFQLQPRNQLQQEYYNRDDIINMQNGTEPQNNINLTPGNPSSNLPMSSTNTEPSYVNVHNEQQYLPMSGGNRTTTAKSRNNQNNRKYVNIDEAMHGR